MYICRTAAESPSPEQSLIGVKLLAAIHERQDTTSCMYTGQLISGSNLRCNDVIHAVVSRGRHGLDARSLSSYQFGLNPGPLN